MSTQSVNVARFARNVEWDFFCDFQTPCFKKLPKERLMIGQLIYFGLFEEKWGRNTCEWNTREESLQALASLKCIHRKCNTELHNYYSTASRFSSCIDVAIQTFSKGYFQDLLDILYLEDFWVAFAHNVWKLLKISHLNFLILALSTNFCPIKTDLSGNTVWQQDSAFQKLFKMDNFWHF